MWPWVIEQPFRIGSYGLMMATGFLTAWALLARELRRRGLPSDLATATIFLAATTGLLWDTALQRVRSRRVRRRTPANR